MCVRHYLAAAEAIANGAMTIEGSEVLLKDVFDALPKEISYWKWQGMKDE